MKTEASVCKSRRFETSIPTIHKYIFNFNKYVALHYLIKSDHPTKHRINNVADNQLSHDTIR